MITTASPPGTIRYQLRKSANSWRKTKNKEGSRIEALVTRVKRAHVPGGLQIVLQAARSLHDGGWIKAGEYGIQKQQPQRQLLMRGAAGVKSRWS